MAKGKSHHTSDWEPPKLTKLSLTDLPNGRYSAAEIYTGPDHWYRYASAYKEAADRFVELLREDDDTYERNMFGPPMMFLYRHSIELHLKSLLLAAGQLLDDPQTVPPEHYLWKLWVRVRKLILRVADSGEDEWVRRADQIIKEFDQLDPTSFAFRYPTARDGKPSLEDGVLVDPPVVSQVMSELHLLLDGASQQIAVYEDYKRDSYDYNGY